MCAYKETIRNWNSNEGRLYTPDEAAISVAEFIEAEMGEGSYNIMPYKEIEMSHIWMDSQFEQWTKNQEKASEGERPKKTHIEALANSFFHTTEDGQKEFVTRPIVVQGRQDQELAGRVREVVVPRRT